MTYQSLINEHQDNLAIENKGYEKIARFRIITFLVMACSLVLVYYFKLPLEGWILFALSLIAFIFLILKHNKSSKIIDRLKALIRINEDSLKRLNNEWHDFEDEGAEYVDVDHPYSRDLDIFGKASLFQWINVSNTEAGRAYLKSYLESPYSKYDQLKDLQDAVKELSDKVRWRQDFQYAGMVKAKKDNKQKKSLSIESLIGDQQLTFKNPAFSILFKITPLILIAALIFANMSLYAYMTAIILIAVHLLLLSSKKSRFNEVFYETEKTKTTIQKYSRLIQCFEEQDFNSPYLNSLKEKLINEKQLKASVQIKEFQKILELIDIRQSFIHFALNIIALWDIHCLILLEKWRIESGTHLQDWMDVISELEALSSLAIIPFDNPDWVMPEFIETASKGDSKILTAQSLAHPLIQKDERVENDFTVNEVGEIAIFTGSNMSGKSTFLRTLGLNLLFAYLGLPVCGKEFRCVKMKIFTSMRITDNLDKHISSFFAELLRIKKIIDLSENDELTLFLIDEIFRGTNSRDRITGAKEILKKLSKSYTVGLVTTHDLELTELSKDANLKIRNYHLKESYKDGKIIFDYKIYPDVASTSNAIFLMKMVGIDVQDN